MTREEANGLKKVAVVYKGTLSPVDAYVIDVFAKDPVYPQSRKRLYISKDNLQPYYAIAWDRAGKLWKIFTLGVTPFHIPGDDPISVDSETFAVDVQFGISNLLPFNSTKRFNKGGSTREDFAPSALIRLAR